MCSIYMIKTTVNTDVYKEDVQEAEIIKKD